MAEESDIVRRLTTILAILLCLIMFVESQEAYICFIRVEEEGRKRDEWTEEGRTLGRE